MKFNNINMPDWFRIVDVYGRGIATQSLDLISVNGMDGAHLSGVTTPPRFLELRVRIDATNRLELSERIDEINAILDVQEPVPIVFPDEPDFTYYGLPEIASGEGRKTFFTRDTITIICPDPYKYGPEKTVGFPSDLVIIENDGSKETFPVYEMTVTAPITFAMIQKQSGETLLIGEPTSVQQTLVNDRNVVLDERGESLSSWGTPPIKIDGTNAVIGGSIGTDGTGIVPSSYGTGPAWHGPALAKEIPAIQDFELEMRCRVELDRSSDTFRIETYLFDEGLNVIGKLAIVDNTINISQIAAEGRYGDFRGVNEGYAISSRNYLRRAQHFHGVLRLTRRGNNFEFYVARLATGTVIPKHNDVLRVSYTDTSQTLTGKLKYVQMHFGKFGSSTSATVPRINQLKVTELTQVTEDQTPYIAYPGDMITFDTKSEEILINGEDAMRYKAFISKFFPLEKGENILAVLPENSFEVEARYRERRK